MTEVRHDTMPSPAVSSSVPSTSAVVADRPLPNWNEGLPATSEVSAAVILTQVEVEPIQPLAHQLADAQQALDEHQAQLEVNLQAPIPRVIVGDQGQDLPVVTYDPEETQAARARAQRHQQAAFSSLP